MVENLFKAVLNISFMGIVAVIIIAALKLILGKKLPPKWHYCIWLLLIARLAVPISLPSPYSIFTILQHNETFSHINILNSMPNEISINKPVASRRINSQNTKKIMSIQEKTIKGKINDNEYNLSKSYSQANEKHNLSDFKETLWHIASYIWTIVFLTLLLVIGISYMRIFAGIKKFIPNENTQLSDILSKCILKSGIRAKVKIVVTKQFDTPFVFGIIKPIIVIPEKALIRLSDREVEYILLHEIMHIKWKDNLVNLFSLFLQAMHWFNPVLLFGFKKMKNDCELACDARVLELLTQNQHKEYANTLLEMAKEQSSFSFAYSGLGFGESNILRRVKEIMNFKKASIGSTFLAIIMAISVAGLVNTNATQTNSLKAKPALKNSLTTAKSATSQAKKPKLVPKNNDYVIPYSNQRLLVDEDLSFLNASQLFYARNEIYARHGYIFTNKDCINYFGNEIWYHKNSKFNANSLSAIEKANAAFLKKAEADYAKKPAWEKFGYSKLEPIKIGDTVLAAQSLPIAKNKLPMKFNYKCNVNYNEDILDNNKYQVSVTVQNPKFDGEGKYNLNIDGKTIQDDCIIENSVWFDIVKLNSHDNFKYIIVKCGDFDDWFRLNIYTFDGTAIKKVGQIMGTQYVNYDQNGVIEAGTIGRVLQSHICPLYYKITSSKMDNINLKFTPYTIYSNNKMQSNKMMLKTNLTLYKGIGSKQVAVKLHAGDLVYQICNFGNNYVCLKTPNGAIGWFHISFANANDYNGKIDGTGKIPDNVLAGIIQFD